MGRPRNPNTGMLVAREAVVVIVGAEKAVYDQVEVVDRKTGEKVWINKDRPRVEAKEGIPYAFKQFQRVHPAHPAVKTQPNAFIPISELDDAALELVHS